MVMNKYESIEELDKIGAWELLRKYAELDESDNTLFISTDMFRGLINDIMTEPDEFEEDILLKLREGLGSVYDELLEGKTIFLNFIHEDEDN